MLATERLRRDGGKLIAEIRFKERTKADAGPTQTVADAPKTLLVADAANDQMRMLGIERKKSARRFETGVTGLNDLLWRGEIAPDEDVHVGRRIYLQELHNSPPFCDVPTIASGGTRTRMTLGFRGQGFAVKLRTLHPPF